MLKKAAVLTRPTPARGSTELAEVQDAPFPVQGRSERRGEEVHTALRVGRSPFGMGLGERISPYIFSASKRLMPIVEPLSDARTTLADFFSILLELPQHQHEHPADQVWNHTGVEQDRLRSVW